MMRFHLGDFNFGMFVLVAAAAVAFVVCGGNDDAAAGHPMPIPAAAFGGGFEAHRHHPLQEPGPGNPYPPMMTDVRRMREDIEGIRRDVWRLRVALAFAEAELDAAAAGLFPAGHPGG